MKFIELFAGIGGFRYGLEGKWSIYRCVWANEIDKYACQIYRKNFGGGELYEGDIRTVRPEDIPDHDLLVGGFPCQAFSIAGKRAGFNDTRGTLFFEIARILRDKRPRCVLLENVKGLLSHDSGKTFQTILKVLSDIGYRVEWQVLNSKNFGVPQNRERVFIIGYIRGEGGGQVFPIGESNEISNGRIKKELSYRNQKTVYNPNGIAPTFREGHGDGIRIIDDYNHKIKEDNICGTVRQTFNNSKDGNGCKLLNGTKIRRLTPTECERLQGFPDGWTEGISDTQRYKCLGNAVTTNVISAIGERLFL